MSKPIARDSMYRRRSFDADIIELCFLVHHLPAELSRSRGDDGGAWCGSLGHADLTMADSVCSRVREALESWYRGGAGVLPKGAVDESYAMAA